MIRLENARISNSMLETIRYWQEEEAMGLDEDVRAIDDAITFIACEHDNPDVLTDKELRTLIAALSFVKKRLRQFTGKDKE